MEGTVMTFGTVLFGVLILLIVVVVARSVALIPQGEAAVIERLGRYTRTVSGGLTLLIPFIDRIRAKVDTRERVFSFPPQAVITQDNPHCGHRHGSDIPGQRTGTRHLRRGQLHRRRGTDLHRNASRRRGWHDAGRNPHLTRGD